jgi:transcriptional regulator with XRE-family HTH domain
MGRLEKLVGQRIEKVRTERGLSREKVASSVDLDPVTLYRIERAKQGITLANVEALAAYFKVPPESFLTDNVVKVEPTPAEAWAIVGEALKGLSPPPAADPELDRLTAVMESDNPYREQILGLVREFERQRGKGVKGKASEEIG